MASPTDQTAAVQGQLLGVSNPDSPTKRLLRGVSWTMAGTVLGQAIALMGSIVVARILGKAAFGQYGTIQSTALMLSGIAGAGFGITATRYVSMYRATDPAHAGRVLGMLTMVTSCTGLLFAVGLVASANSFATRAFNAPSLALPLALSSVYVLFATLNGYQLGALAGLEAFKRLASLAVFQASFNVALCLFCASRWGVPGAVAALSASSLVAFFAYNAILQEQCRREDIQITYRHAFQERSAFVTFGLPAAVIGIIANVAIWSCNVMTANAPNGFKELGAISVANNLRQAILFVPAIVTRVALPINCDQHSSGQNVQSGILWQLKLTLAFAIVVAAIVLGASPYVLRVLGKEFAGDISVIAIFSGFALLEVAVSSIAQVLVVYSKLWYAVLTMSIWAILLVGISWLLLHTMRPALAVGIGYLLAWGAAFALYVFFTARLLRNKQ